MKKNIAVILFLSLVLFNCQDEATVNNVNNYPDFIAKNVVIIVIDGPRYQETWGDNDHSYIPVQSELIKKGVFFNNFYNEGSTYTLSGHAAITTGYYEHVKNNGTELPQNRSIFQEYLAQTQLPPTEAYIVSGKDKLRILANAKDLNWRGSYMPSVDAEKREDSLTLKASFKVLTEFQPNLSMIHFQGPDKYGHENNWTQYLESLKETDSYIGQLYEFLQSHPAYKDNTAIFVTNDHGRHLTGISTGFEDHGCNCEGCKRISLLVFGPDFKVGSRINNNYGQTDIAPTIAAILNINWKSEGEVIEELFL